MVKLDELVVLHPGGQLRKAQMVPVLHRLKNLAGHLYIGVTSFLIIAILFQMMSTAKKEHSEHKKWIAWVAACAAAFDF